MILFLSFLLSVQISLRPVVAVVAVVDFVVRRPSSVGNLLTITKSADERRLGGNLCVFVSIVDTVHFDSEHALSYDMILRHGLSSTAEAHSQYMVPPCHNHYERRSFRLRCSSSQ